MAIANRVRSLRASGVDVINFTQGEPDFDTPAHIQQAAEDAMRNHDTHYTPSRGYPELRSAIADYYRREHGITFNPDREIIVTPGAKHALYATFQALIGPGCEVLVPQPCWLSYVDMIRLAGGVPVPIQSTADEGYIPAIEALDQSVTSRTRMVIINNPCNPTGVVWPRKKLEEFAEWANRRNLLVISDEIYDRIVYDGFVFFALASFPGMADRTITINGLSKTYAMTGWRIGYVCGPSVYLDSILTVHENIATCATSFVQRAAVAALTGPQSVVSDMTAEYQARRDILLEELSDISGFSCRGVQGTFYALVHVEGDDRIVADSLLSDVGVATVPGSAYGESARGCLRVSFACSQSTLREGLSRIRNFMNRAKG